MELNSKKLQRTSRIVYYSISIILCIFLILLSNRIIGDLDSTTRMPYSEDFEDKNAIIVLDDDIEKLNLELANIYAKQATVEKTIATAKDNHANEKQSFENWLRTRKTLGSPDKDHEVIARVKKLDEFIR